MLDIVLCKFVLCSCEYRTHAKGVYRYMCGLTLSVYRKHDYRFSEAIMGYAGGLGGRCIGEHDRLRGVDEGLAGSILWRTPFTHCA